jgi:hypothetical protein
MSCSECLNDNGPPFPCHPTDWPRQHGTAFGLPKTHMVPGKDAANAYFCQHERKKLLIGKFAHVSWNYWFDGRFLQ